MIVPPLGDISGTTSPRFGLSQPINDRSGLPATVCAVGGPVQLDRNPIAPVAGVAN